MVFFAASRAEDCSSISGDSSASLDVSEDDLPTNQQTLLYENELNAVISTLVTVILTAAINEVDKELSEQKMDQEKDVMEEKAELEEVDAEKVGRKESAFFVEENFVRLFLFFFWPITFDLKGKNK